MSSTQHRAERTRHWFSDDVAEAGRLLADLRTMGPELITRAAIPVDDGFPSRGGGSDGRSSSGHRDLSDVIVRLEYLEEHPEIDRDPVRTHTDQMLVHMGQALEALRRADAARAAALRVPASELGETREVPGCVNCDRFDVASPVHKRVDGLPSGGRCRACYEYRRRHDGRDAPEAIVRARPEVSGRRRRVKAA